jgi:helix-turn-helix protein
VTESRQLTPGRVSAPSLAEVLADAAIVDRLPLDVLVVLRHQLRHLDADLGAAITRQMVRANRPLAHDLEDVSILTTTQLAALWGVAEAKVRALCRTGRLAAMKLGGKEWVIPVAALRAQIQTGLASADNVTLPCCRETPGCATDPPPARPYTVAVRRPARRSRENGHSVGIGDGRDERHDTAADPVTRRKGRGDPQA